MATDPVYTPVHTHPANEPKASHKRQQRRWTRWIADGWLVEIACTILGLALIIVLSVVLRAYEGKPVPSLGSAFGAALTLNTVVAIISTCAKAALLLPIAECISQLKWAHFEKEYQPLTDLGTFDRASRGIIGGVELLWKTRFRDYASIGALVMILAIAIDPLSQQLVSQRSLRVASFSGNATVGILNTWSEQQEDSGNLGILGAGYDPTKFAAISSGMKNAVQSGIYHPDGSIAALSPACPSGNCTFDAYWSLAVCADLADVSSHLTTEQKRLNGSVYPQSITQHHITPNVHIGDEEAFALLSSANGTREIGGYVKNGFEYLTMPYNFDSIAFQHNDGAIADFYVIYANGYDPNGHRYAFGAIEVILEWCVQKFTTQSINGTAVSTMHNAIKNFDMASSSGSSPGIRPFGNSGTPYTVERSTHNILQRYLGSVFNGTVTHPEEWYATSDVAQALFQPFNIWTGNRYGKVWPVGARGTNQTGLELVMGNIATSMTNYMRLSNLDRDEIDILGTPATRVANGTIWHERNVVVVRWEWITAHVMFALLVVILLVVSIVYQASGAFRSIGALKSSSLAVAHALEPTLQEEFGSVGRSSVMHERDRKHMVTITRMADGGWRLVAEPKSDNATKEANGAHNVE